MSLLDATKEWFDENGEYHRLDGPARIWDTGQEDWWVNGKHVTEEIIEWMKEYSIRPDWQNWGDVEKTLLRLRF